MAMATLVLCYNNPNVFKGVVKIRRGQAVELMMTATNMDEFKGIIFRFSEELLAKIDPFDPTAVATRKIVCKIMSLCSDSLKCQHQKSLLSSSSVNVYSFIGVVTLIAIVIYAAMKM